MPLPHLALTGNAALVAILYSYFYSDAKTSVYTVNAQYVENHLILIQRKHLKTQ